MTEKISFVGYERMLELSSAMGVATRLIISNHPDVDAGIKGFVLDPQQLKELHEWIIIRLQEISSVG